MKNLFTMHYGDELKHEISGIYKDGTRFWLSQCFKKYETYIKNNTQGENNEEFLTFGEFITLYC